MTIVVDLGCATYPDHPSDESVHRLVERFSPSYLYGFDPHPDLDERPETIGETLVIRSRKAAWTYDGTVGYTRAPATVNDLRAFVGGNGTVRVPCFDLAEWLLELGRKVILKMDVEGAERALIPHLVETGTIELVDLLLVEWHDVDPRPEIPCSVEEW